MLKVTAKLGPAPIEIALAFKCGWSVSKIMKESGLGRTLVEAVIRKYVRAASRPCREK